MYQDHEFIYTSSEGDGPMCQIWYANVNANRSYEVRHKETTETSKSDFKIKGQCRIRIINVCKTSSLGDRRM